MAKNIVYEKYLLEALDRISRHPSGYSVLYIHISKLRPKNRHPEFVKIFAKLFDSVAGNARGMLFILSNGDFAILGKDITHEVVDEAVMKLRDGLSTDPILHLHDSKDFFEIYDFPEDFSRFYDYVADLKDKAAYVAGHSLGEYSAACAAGVFSLSDTAKLLRIRGDAMQQAVPVGVGGMAAVLGLSYKDVGALVEACNDENHFCVAANDNSDGQVVLSGHIQAIEKAVEIASEFGAKRCLKLPVSAPFHSPLMQPAAETMARAFMEVQTENAQIPIVANVLAAPETEKKEIIKNLIEQVTGTVRWRETMSFFDADGVTDLVEIGAGKVLSGLAKRSLKNINSVSVCSVQEIEELAKNL